MQKLLNILHVVIFFILEKLKTKILEIGIVNTLEQKQLGKLDPTSRK
jgi:hypothetical protein